jgi:uncharacterized membrane protein
MKKLFSLFLIAYCFFSMNAQVLIGFSSANSVSSILEVNAANGGIILPWVDNSTIISPIAGSIIYDTSDSKIKLRNNSSWIDLTNTGQNNVTKLNEQNTYSESGQGLIMGTDSPTASGILELNSTNKALLLPRINNVSLMVQPEAGTMVYDLTRKTIAIFNGTVWSFLSKN